MKYQLLYICLLVLLAGTSRAQLNIDSLFLTADSITLINTGFFDEEILNEGFNQVFCHESPFHYATNSKELVNRTLDRLNFRESADILFCGDSTNLNSVYQLLIAELGKSAALDTLLNEQNYWY
ncbi:MAG: hypothetical protein OEY56_04085 [Cyclobacteriaceae bacterium]|nr:hypothetical protein [Cyclobacteriaceae bacterium]